MRALQRKWRWIASGGAALAIALTWILWPAPPIPEPPRARQYLQFTACLLTNQSGVTGESAAPVWAGMQDASLQTLAKVQYLAITGPQTADNGVTFLNSQAQAGCDLLFAAGDVAVATVDQAAAQFPQKRFYPVAGGTATANVHPIPAATPGDVRATVAATISAAVAEGSAS